MGNQQSSKIHLYISNHPLPSPLSNSLTCGPTTSYTTFLLPLLPHESIHAKSPTSSLPSGSSPFAVWELALLRRPPPRSSPFAAWELALLRRPELALRCLDARRQARLSAPGPLPAHPPRLSHRRELDSAVVLPGCATEGHRAQELTLFHRQERDPPSLPR